MVEGGKGKREQKIYYIDDFNLPANTNLRLEKEDDAQAKYRLRSIQSYELEEFLSPGNDPIYFQDLAVELLHSLERLKREMETKHHLKADIWCHFGTVFIDQPDEDTDREWNIENAVHKLLEGKKWKTAFKTVVNFDEKFLEQHLGNQLHPEYDDYILSRYDSVFETPNEGQLRFKFSVDNKTGHEGSFLWSSITLKPGVLKTNAVNWTQSGLFSSRHGSQKRMLEKRWRVYQALTLR
ncbi:uncharacterized protein [Montipora capricornis]|uniref:uncharacterized protein n=1 Tax=Montipora capricornis TaxID=246305 RepID=UPI0035F1D4A2